MMGFLIGEAVKGQYIAIDGNGGMVLTENIKEAYEAVSNELNESLRYFWEDNGKPKGYPLLHEVNSNKEIVSTLTLSMGDEEDTEEAVGDDSTDKTTLLSRTIKEAVERTIAAFNDEHGTDYELTDESVEAEDGSTRDFYYEVVDHDCKECVVATLGFPPIDNDEE